MSKSIAIITAIFCKDIASILTSDAIKYCEEQGQTQYQCIEVPGAFEIPALLSAAIKSKKYDIYIILGCVIRGETSHYDHICNEVSSGVNKLAIDNNAALGFGVITAENYEQAMFRAKDRAIGTNTAKVALDMHNTIQQVLE